MSFVSYVKYNTSFGIGFFLRQTTGEVPTDSSVLVFIQQYDATIDLRENTC
jgi:hypothetical protein